MPTVRYRLPGVPPGPAAGLSAFLPSYEAPASSGAQSYKYALVGSPGTTAIPAAPTYTDAGSCAQAQMGGARSSDAPPAWWPQQYYQAQVQERPGAGMPIRLPDWTTPGPNTVLPVPAGNYAQVYQVASARLAQRTILQRVKQLPWFPRLYKAPSA